MNFICMCPLFSLEGTYSIQGGQPRNIYLCIKHSSIFICIREGAANILNEDWLYIIIQAHLAYSVVGVCVVTGVLLLTDAHIQDITISLNSPT